MLSWVEHPLRYLSPYVRTCLHTCQGEAWNRSHPTIRMCTWQTLEEERVAFPNNSNSSKIYRPCAQSLLTLFPSLSACVCSCDTSVVRSLRRAWHIQPLYSWITRGEGYDLLVSKDLFTWVFPFMQNKWTLWTACTEEFQLLEVFLYFCIWKKNLLLLYKKGMANFSLEGNFMKIKTRNENTNQIFTTVMQKLLLYDSKIL